MLSYAHCLLSIFTISGILAHQAAAPKFNWDAIEYVYAFGDSYTFVQGTRGHANFSFIGDALNLPFTPMDLLTNEIVPRNTSSEGSNWVEFLTGCFGGRPSACRKQLWNFAFAGADIDGALLPRHHDYTTPLVDQVNQWATYGSKIIPHPVGKTLTAWWIGINDTGDTVNNSTIIDFEAFWELEISTYFKAVQLAYDNGLRDHLFINVPPGDRAPASVGNPAKANVQKLHINQYNTILAKYVARFATTNPSATVLSFDANTWFNSVLDNPTANGFSNVTSFCTCPNPTGYFWYNSGHPTEATHKLLANAIEEQLRVSSLY